MEKLLLLNLIEKTNERESINECLPQYLTIIIFFTFENNFLTNKIKR